MIVVSNGTDLVVEHLLVVRNVVRNTDDAGTPRPLPSRFAPFGKVHCGKSLVETMMSLIERA